VLGGVLPVRVSTGCTTTGGDMKPGEFVGDMYKLNEDHIGSLRYGYIKCCIELTIVFLRFMSNFSQIGVRRHG
jgi:hypothetical protein